jgi:LacI family transcriptional regulator
MPTIATIKDIARKAKVGVSTVSRVLNSHPDVSTETRDKVLRIAEELKYRPHSRARQLVRDTTETICFVMSNREVISPFHSHVLTGVEQFARRLAHNVIFMRFDYRPDVAASDLVLPPVIWERGNVDGLIIAGMNYPNFIRAVKRLDIPFVLFGNNLVGQVRTSDIDTVWFDSKGGTRKSTEYLIGLGHRDIWFIADLSLPWYRRCFEGYLQAMEGRGLQPRSLEPKMDSPPFDYGYASADEILKLGHRVSAIVAGDDQIACGLLSKFNQQGVRVPNEISIVGFDDIDEAKYFHPPLTTVHVPKEKIGEEMARVLFDKLADPSRPTVKLTVPTDLVIRESCAAPPKRNRSSVR